MVCSSSCLGSSGVRQWRFVIIDLFGLSGYCPRLLQRSATVSYKP